MHKMKRLQFFALCLCVSVVCPSFANEITTPAEVWAGFDPRAEPLEVEVLKEWDEHGAHYREFFFTGMTHEGSKVRVYAVYSAPIGAMKLPAVLHIHGGGQTAYAPWLKHWNNRGYAALTFNWGGRWEGRK